MIQLVCSAIDRVLGTRVAKVRASALGGLGLGLGVLGLLLLAAVGSRLAEPGGLLPPCAGHDLARGQPGQRLLVCISRTHNAGRTAFRADGLCAVADKTAPPALPALGALDGCHGWLGWHGCSMVITGSRWAGRGAGRRSGLCGIGRRGEVGMRVEIGRRGEIRHCRLFSFLVESPSPSRLRVGWAASWCVMPIKEVMATDKRFHHEGSGAIAGPMRSFPTARVSPAGALRVPCGRLAVTRG